MADVLPLEAQVDGLGVLDASRSRVTGVEQNLFARLVAKAGTTRQVTTG
jgi:hypothetical protein